jgi:hypothetical protein
LALESIALFSGMFKKALDKYGPFFTGRYGGGGK